MAKPAKWDSMTPSEQEAWRAKERGYVLKWRKLNGEKVQEKSKERSRKWRKANREKKREREREYRKANPEKILERERKSKQKTKQQTAADQFFILAGAAESISKLKLKSESK
jgi:hypothetical protein